MAHRYCVHLTDDQREFLTRLLRAGMAPARRLAHARSLLKADAGWTDQAVAHAVESSQPTIFRVRKQFVEQGLEAALDRCAPRRLHHRKLDGAQEARLVALACSQPPPGQARWTLRLLADKLVELPVTDAVSYQTVRRTLKIRGVSPG